MIVFDRGGDVSQIQVFTLKEKTTLTTAFYLFVFTHTTSSNEVKFIKGSSDELSNYTDRFNKFSFLITPFAEKSKGFWDYKVYEQEDGDNEDTEGLTLVEEGYMKLIDDAEIETTTYNRETERVVYER